MIDATTLAAMIRLALADDHLELRWPPINVVPNKRGKTPVLLLAELLIKQGLNLDDEPYDADGYGIGKS